MNPIIYHIEDNSGNSRFLGLVSVGAARSLDQTALRPSVIKRIRQMTLNTKHTCKVYLRKKWKCTQNGKKEETCKNNMVSSKNETVLLRIIYKSPLNVPTTPAACGGTGSSVKRSENLSHPIPSIGLGRQTTTTIQ